MSLAGYGSQLFGGVDSRRSAAALLMAAAVIAAPGASAQDDDDDDGLDLLREMSDYMAELAAAE